MQGRILGNKYRLLRHLGKGGMGSVWEAEHLSLPIRFAVKLIDPERSHSIELRERFKREAHAAAKLRSAHIVRISDYGIDAGLPYIVMELLEGESLAERLARRGNLSSRETLHILAQVAKALELAHAHGIVHRDLKPQNIFIQGYLPGTNAATDQEYVKVLDFGVAKILVAQPWRNGIRTRTGESLGTPVYMSPEQIRDSSKVDQRTDIWSFGVIAYECMTGRRPFEAKNWVDLQFSICRGAATPASRVAAVPEAFDVWLEKALSRDLNARFSTIALAMVQLHMALAMAPRFLVTQQSLAVGETEQILMTDTDVDAAPFHSSVFLDTEGPPVVARGSAEVTTVMSLRKTRTRTVRWSVIASLALELGAFAATGYGVFEKDVDDAGSPTRLTMHADLSTVPATATSDISEVARPLVLQETVPIVAVSALPLEVSPPKNVARGSAGAENLNRRSLVVRSTQMSGPAEDASVSQPVEVNPDYGLY